MNFKERDTERILRYLNEFPKGVAVDEVILYSGDEKLRVYPALFELEQMGRLEVLEREELGAPKRVRLLDAEGALRG